MNEKTTYATEILKEVEVTPADYDEAYRLFGKPYDVNDEPRVTENYDDHLALAMAIIRRFGDMRHLKLIPIGRSETIIEELTEWLQGEGIELETWEVLNITVHCLPYGDCDFYRDVVKPGESKKRKKAKAA